MSSLTSKITTHGLTAIFSIFATAYVVDGLYKDDRKELATNRLAIGQHRARHKQDTVTIRDLSIKVHKYESMQFTRQIENQFLTGKILGQENALQQLQTKYNILENQYERLNNYHSDAMIRWSQSNKKLFDLADALRVVRNQDMVVGVSDYIQAEAAANDAYLPERLKATNTDRERFTYKLSSAVIK